MQPTLRLYDLAGADPDRRFSPYCWRVRMALAHKGLDVETIPWRFTDKASLAQHGAATVPLLLTPEHALADSWAIAEWLEDTYPDRPSLFDGAPEMVRFFGFWADVTLHAGLASLIVADIVPLLTDHDAAYFRQSREARLGERLEDFCADREARLPALRRSLHPMRMTLRHQPFLGGARPNYADYSVFGAFQWARTVSPLALLERDDMIAAWRERLLDLFDGLARRAPAFA